MPQQPQPLKLQSAIERFAANDKAAEPFVPQGATLFCSAKIQPQNGDFIVFAPKDGSPYFIRQYATQQDGSLLLHAPNAAFDSYVSNSTELEASGRILTVLKMERELPACARFGGLPQTAEPAQAKPAAALRQAPPQQQEPQAASTENNVLTFEEAKLALKVHRTKMYELLRTGKLKASKVGKLWRIERQSLQEYLHSSAFKAN